MIKKLALMGAFALASTAAWAGLYQPAPIIVDMLDRFAQGDVTTAANSNNDVEFIGCGSRTFSDGVNSSRRGFCQASDADGNRVVCNTLDPVLVDAIQAISDRAFITFSWVNDGTDDEPVLRCTRVGSSTQSFYLDKIKPSSNDNGKN